MRVEGVFDGASHRGAIPLFARDLIDARQIVDLGMDVAVVEGRATLVGAHRPFNRVGVEHQEPIDVFRPAAILVLVGDQIVGNGAEVVIGQARSVVMFVD